MGDVQTNRETRAERIKRKWDDGEPERAARRVQREAAREAQREAARLAEREAVGVVRRMCRRVADPAWRLLLMLIVLVVVALPTVVVWAFVDSDVAVKAGEVTGAIALCLAVCWMTAGTQNTAATGSWPAAPTRQAS